MAGIKINAETGEVTTITLNAVLNADGSLKDVTYNTWEEYQQFNQQKLATGDVFVSDIQPPEGLLTPAIPDVVSKKWVEFDPAAANLVKQQANIAAIKARAGEIITARYPLWKQEQNRGRQLQLAAKMIGARVNPQGKPLPAKNLTPEEEVEIASLQAACDWIIAVKDTSDLAELNNTPVDDIVWPT